jgi:hypothetical protein
MWNTQKVSDSEAPRTWEDVLNPKWTNRTGSWVRASAFAQLAATQGPDSARRQLERYVALKPMLFFLQPVIDMMKGLVNAIIKAGEWFNRLKKDGGSAMDALKAKIQPIIDAFNRVKGAVQGVIDKIKGIKFPSMPSWLPGFAAGGITMGPSIVGEAGPEMVIPLTRPLSQVDPSVRAIAAMLRGQSSDQVIMGGSTSPTKIVNNEIKVYAPSADPEAVAAQVVNRSVAMAQ